MNNLDRLWAYIRELAPPGGIEGADGQRKFRDLKQYHEDKIAVWANDTSDRGKREKRTAEDLAKDALEVCGLKPNGSELSSLQQDSHKLAVAGTILAMSIVQTKNLQQLAIERGALESMPIGSVKGELKYILTKGYLLTSKKYPGLELKNFSSISYDHPASGPSPTSKTPTNARCPC